jgi:hypothetical protein
MLSQISDSPIAVAVTGHISLRSCNLILDQLANNLSYKRISDGFYDFENDGRIIVSRDDEY